MRLREVVLHALQSKDIWNIDLMDSIPVVLILIFESEPSNLFVERDGV